MYMRLFILLFLCQMIIGARINIDADMNIVYGKVDTENVASDSETNKNNSIVISELDLDEKYSIGSVNFHFENINQNNKRKRIVFEKMDYEFNEYAVIGKVLRLKINGRDNYILWTHYWDSDDRACEILELKDGQINLYWQVAGTYGEMIGYKDNIITFKEVIATDLLNDGADVISNYEVREDGVYQVGDYKIENCEYVTIGHKLPSHMIFEGEDREMLILPGEKIKFTHSDFENKVHFENENGVKGYLVVDRDEEYEMLWIFTCLKVDGVVLEEYFKGRIDDLARLGISKW